VVGAVAAHAERGALELYFLLARREPPVPSPLLVDVAGRYLGALRGHRLLPRAVNDSSRPA
jgi:hypothetical protein